MHRRTFLVGGLGAAAAATIAGREVWQDRNRRAALEDLAGPTPPAQSVIPVVGDGKWIWKDPPKDEKGYLEPRKYKVKIGIQIEGTGGAGSLKATSVAPVEQPGQEINDVWVETRGCDAALRAVAPEAGQLILAAGSIAKGQMIGAVAHFTLTLFKEYQGYEKDQFLEEQKLPKDFRKRYLYDSPGIQTRVEAVRELAEKLRAGITHPWDMAQVFHQWVWQHIRARIGNYTSVVEALRDRVGDCEERATVFVALCRVSGIPARVVWVPNHNWAEIFLTDYDGRGHWIPVHTSCYSWFGWTGAHELILQKGDSIKVPEKRKPWRLLADWMQWQGAKPQVRYPAEITPLPPKPDEDPGPGARSKDAKGQWVLTGKHAMDRYMRV